MKQFILLLIFFFSCSFSFAGGVENKVNYGAEFGRTLNRNSSADSADAVAYNPAGLIRLEEGDYWNAGFQYIKKDYFHDLNNKRYESDKSSPLANFFGVHRKGKNAFFGGIGIVSGGGKVIYSNGSLTTYLGGLQLVNDPLMPFTGIVSQNISLDSIGYGYTIGFARELSSKVSGAFAIKYVDTFRKGVADLILASLGGDTKLQLDFREDADNIGMILGFDAILSKNYRIGIRYESRVKLIYDQKVPFNTLQVPNFTDGGRRRRDLPAVLGIGLAWNVNDRWKTTFDVTTFFQKSAVIDDYAGVEDINNGYDVGMSLEYKANDRLTFSAGYLYTSMGIKPEKILYEAPELDADSYALGFKYKYRKNTSLNLGVVKVDYKPITIQTGVGNAVFDKDESLYLQE